MSRRRSRAPLATTCALLLAACADAGPEGGAGTLAALLVSPHGPEGAALLELVGPGLAQVTAADGRAFSHRNGDTLRVVIVREAPGEIRFLLAVADTTRPPAALLLEVADGGNALRPDLSGYRVEVRP